MKLKPITKSQKQIIFHLYKFRYLLIVQLQLLFNHKDPHRIKEWLIDLESKKYINIIKDQKNITKPYIICLAQRASHILKQDKDIDQNFLKWLYKEKTWSQSFINKNLFIADTYLYFLKNKDKNSELSFFTKQDLKNYEYFPDPIPDAYIDETDGKQNNRYFLDYFDDGISPGKMRFRTRSYFQYYDEGNWQNNTNNAPFPAILMVFPNHIRKKHIYYYSRSLLEKSLNNDIQIFLTTYDRIKSSKENTEIWERV